MQIVNEGRAAVKLKFGLMKNLEASKVFQGRKIDSANQNSKEEKREKIQEKKSINRSNSSLMTLSGALSIEPSEPVVLQPNKKLNLVLKFKPKNRLKQFLEKICAQINNTTLPLTIVKGSCLGAEFQLNRTYISFGSVVEGCTLDTQLILLNTGDVGARLV